MDVCLRVRKERNKSSVDSCIALNSVLIISHTVETRKRPLRKFEKMVVTRAGRLRVLQKLINKETTKEINV